MSHNLNINEATGQASLYLLKQPAWHGLGQVVEEALPSEEIIKIAHLDYTVEKVPNMVQLSTGLVHSGSYSTIRSDNEAVLGNLMLGDYKVVQNSELFEFIDSLGLAKEDIVYHTAGALGKGGVIFISLKLPSYIKIQGGKDIIEQYLMILNSHNATMPFSAQFTDVRPVCNNTVNAALRACTNRVVLRHTSGIQDRMKQGREILNLQLEYNVKLEEAFNHLSKMMLKEEQIKQTINNLFCTKEELALMLTGGQLSTRKQNTMDTIFQALEVAPGQDKFRGTGYWLYNGVTSYFQNVKEYKSADRKMAGVMLGGEEQIIAQRCLNMLLV